MRRLYRATRGRVLGGVCAGLGEYFNIDPVVVRVAWILFGLMGGAGLLAYIVCLFVIPSEADIH